MLQTGNLPTYSLMKKSLRQRTDEIKISDIEKNKQEVNQLNLRILEKINREIKPKIRKVIEENVNGTERKTIPEKSHSVKQETRASLSILQLPKPSRPVKVAKTHVKVPEGDAEIYRYSFDDLFQLQYFATWEIVPRLVELNICATPLTDGDKLLMKLISLKDNGEILKAVLDEAEKRQFVTQDQDKSFKFSRVMNGEQQKQHETSQEFEKIKATAKSDDELNEAIFHHEFVKIFGGSLEQSISDNVKDLIDSNEAYIIEGEVRVNGKNFHEAYITHPQGKKDVCMQKIALRQYAFNGDYVKVLVMQENVNSMEENNRSFGCVLEIIEKRHSRRVVGSITSDTKKKNIIFRPRDQRIPTVRINKNSISNDIEMSDQSLLVVEITGFVNDQGKGNIVDIIGIKGDLKSENIAILSEHNLDPQPFAADIEEQFLADFVIPESEFAYREDLRKKCIFSIDPESARDLDDALSCEELPNGNIEIGVHISDVSFFLKENSELDEIVKGKATTIYLVDQVYHMLPVSLCMRCSLLPGTDKIAYSVFWEMNQETGEILSTRFARSIVNSCGKLSYDHAQNVIEGKSCEFPEIFNGFTTEDVSAVILKLQKIAVILRQKRKERGALKIDQPKIAFKFNDNKFTAPTDFFKYEIKDSNRLIEEFMLLANISVAEFIYKKFPSISLLRCHPPPNEGGLNKLIKTLEKQGFAIDTSSSSSISESMEKLIAENRGMNGVLNLMVSKTMNRARYFCSEMAKEENEFCHYALAIPMYTHFTSPIRRYADVLVHRVLNAALDYEPVPSRTPDEVHHLANVCNVQKYAAKLAGDDSCELYFKSFIKSLKSKAMMAGVVGVYEFNLELVLLETGHVIKVFYKVKFNLKFRK